MPDSATPTLSPCPARRARPCPRRGRPDASGAPPWSWPARPCAPATCNEWPRGDGHPVIVLPGFLAGPESTAFLRSHLRRLGYHVARLAARSQPRRQPRARRGARGPPARDPRPLPAQGQPIGWSAGGIYAREMARTLPDYTRSVITLGSPFRGHPASTRAWRVYRVMNRNNLEKMFTDEALATRAAPSRCRRRASTRATTASSRGSAACPSRRR